MIRTALVAAAALAVLAAAPAAASVPKTLACLRDAPADAALRTAAQRACPVRRVALAATPARPRVLTATTMEELGRRQLDQLIASIR